jgi:hypothetical protein
MNLIVILAVLGALAIAAGVGLIYLPAGLIVGGLEMLAAGYVAQYLRAKS